MRLENSVKTPASKTVVKCITVRMMMGSLYRKVVFMEQIEYIRLPLKSTINTLKTALPF